MTKLGDLTDEEVARALLAATEQSPDAVLLADGDGTVRWASSAAQQVLGRSADALVGTSLHHLVAPGSARLLEQRLATLASGRASVALPARWAGPAGSTFPAVATLTAVRTAGELSGVCCVLRDESRRRPVVRDDVLAALARRSAEATLVTDEDLTIRVATPAVTTAFGFPVEDLVGAPGWQFVHPDDVPKVRRRLQAVLAGPAGSSSTWTARVRDADGRWRWVEGTVGNFTTDLEIAGLVVHLRDVGERMDAVRALRQSQSRYRAIVHAAHEGIWAVGQHGETLSANPKLAEILGVTLAEIYAGLVPDALHAVAREATAQSGDILQQEVAVARPGAEEQLLSVSVSPLRLDEGASPAALLMVADVTAARHNELALRWQALHDPLTGVANRAAFHDRLQAALARPGTLALLYLDVDNLKLVNDSHGHEVGDQLLREVARRLQEVAGEQRLVARLGGDEFVVLAEGLGRAGARALADAVIVSLAAPVALLEDPVHAGVSIGVAVAPPCEPQSLLECADIAMYRAKKTPGLRVSTYDARGLDRSVRTMALANAVRRALNRDHVELHYQPIVDLASGDVVGAEALLRHRDEALGMVPAAEFAAVAERYGWTVELDRLVMRTACADLARMRAEGLDLRYVSVNVSPSTPGGRLRELAADALRLSALPASALMLEVTENTVMEDADTAIRWLQQLRAHGIAIAVDDFGTGYSSLARLHRLPLHVLKVDRSFVQAAQRERGALEITRSIVLLAKTFGLRTVAEGVETEDQARVVREIGCDLAQGYLWSPAVPPDEFGGLLSR